MLTMTTTTTPFEIAFGTELYFTRMYQQAHHESAALREAHCLAAQFPAILLPIRPDDWFAGRVRYAAVGFSPQYGSNQGVGYYCDEPLLRQRLQTGNFSAAEYAEVEAMLAFWREESTYAKVRGAFSSELRVAFPSDEWTSEPRIAFPLYRMAGAVLDYDTLLQAGIGGLLVRIQQQQALNPQHAEFYTALRLALTVLQDSALYLAEQASELALQATTRQQEARLLQMATTLCHLVDHAPTTLYEALQLSYLYTMHTTLQSNYGRMDVYLGDFYARDLAAGRLTHEEALDMLCAFWRILPAYEEFLEVAKFDTRVIIGGRGRRNETNADAFALLALEASERVRGIVPQLSLRCYAGMNPQVYEKALAVIGVGCTFPILYNDDVNIPAVSQAFQISQALAEQYTPFGCGEYVIAHTSFGTPNAIINLPKALEAALFNGRDARTGAIIGLPLGALTDFATFDDLFSAYQQQVSYFTHASAQFQALAYRIVGQEAAFLFMALLYQDCLQRGQGMFSGGVQHLGGTYETYGNITTADSLTALQQCVYTDKSISATELLAALSADFDGYTALRQRLLDAPKFGNDDPCADHMAQRVHVQLCQTTRQQAQSTALDSFLVVVINNSANVLLGQQVAATADGRLAGAPLTNGNTPTNGADRNGITALLNSLVKLDPTMHAGATHNLKFAPSWFKRHRSQLQALLQTYFEQGGTQAMLTVVSRQDLLNALVTPEQYANLIVRVGGFSARFIDLPAAVQQDLVQRTLWE
jgi:pyruvate-formate lyase